MSIRGFHIIFITIATLLCLGLSFWVFKLSGMSAGTGMYALGGGSLFSAIVLVLYGVYFYQKIKKLNI